jgi:hypothetical protein
MLPRCLHALVYELSEDQVLMACSAAVRLRHATLYISSCLVSSLPLCPDPLLSIAMLLHRHSPLSTFSPTDIHCHRCSSNNVHPSDTVHSSNSHPCHGALFRAEARWGPAQWLVQWAGPVCIFVSLPSLWSTLTSHHVVCPFSPASVSVVSSSTLTPSSAVYP